MCRLLLRVHIVKAFGEKKKNYNRVCVAFAESKTKQNKQTNGKGGGGRVLSVLIIVVGKYSKGFRREKYHNRVCVAFVKNGGVS